MSSETTQRPTCGSDFVAEVNSTFEPIMIAKVCEPLLRRIPERVHPNTISLLSHVVCWTTAALATASPYAGPFGQPLLLVAAALGIFATMVGDCLDGMQARRTNRCSKLGELMDHWLDSIHVPLTSVVITMPLQLPPWAIAAMLITATMVYNAQLILYHHRGQFVHPSTSGADAQCGITIALLTCAVVFTLIPRDNRWLDLVLLGFAVVAILQQLRLSWFYYARLRKLTVHHLPFVLLCGGYAALYLLGACDSVTFALAITFLSFRITGSYVLRSILKQPYAGFDWGALAWIPVIAAAHFLALHTAAGSVACYAALAYLVGRNLFDFFSSYAQVNELDRASRPCGCEAAQRSVIKSS